MTQFSPSAAVQFHLTLSHEHTSLWKEAINAGGTFEWSKVSLEGKWINIVCSAASGTRDVTDRTAAVVVQEQQLHGDQLAEHILFFFMIILIFFFLSVFFTAPACQGNLLHQPRREFQVCPVTEADTEEVRWMDKVKEETRRPGAAVPKPGIKHALFAPRELPLWTALFLCRL